MNYTRYSVRSSSLGKPVRSLFLEKKMTQPKLHWLGFLVGCGILCSSCALIDEDADSDRLLNRNDRPEAERTARERFSKDTGCPNPTLKILSVKDTEGAPMGPVWGNYSMDLKGCNHAKTYLIECKGTYTKPVCMIQD